MIAILTVAVLVGFAGWVTGLPALLLSFLLGVIAVMWYLGSSEALIVTPDQVEYRHKTILGSREVIAPRSALLAVRMARGSAHEIRTYCVDLALSHGGLPAAVRVYESLEKERARAVANQIATQLSSPLLPEA